MTSTVPRADFEKLYSELTNALEREKRAQDILNEQSDQLKDMERRLTAVNKNSEQADITLAEAVKVAYTDLTFITVCSTMVSRYAWVW